MKVDILLDGGSGHVSGPKVTWTWKGGLLRVYESGILRFEAPMGKVLAVTLTEPN